MLTQMFRLPPDVGLSFGAEDDSRFVVLQIHYDNPQGLSGKCIAENFKCING